jgi:molybdopterin converting factor small subunit
MRSKPSESAALATAARGRGSLNVRIPGLLRSYTAGAAEVRVELVEGGATLAHALAALDARYPGMRFRIIDEQNAVRPHIKLFVDGTLARDLSTPVRADGELMIVGALSGG